MIKKFYFVSAGWSQARRSPDGVAASGYPCVFPHYIKKGWQERERQVMQFHNAYPGSSPAIFFFKYVGT